MIRYSRLTALLCDGGHSDVELKIDVERRSYSSEKECRKKRERRTATEQSEDVIKERDE